MKKNFVILTELGKRNSGSGHFSRSLILKRKIKKNCKIIIPLNKNIKINKEQNISFIKKDIDVKNYIKKNYKNILIIDKYKFNRNSLKIIEKYFNKIFIFNDLKFLKNDKKIFSFYPQTLKKLRFKKNFIEGHGIFPVDQKLISIRKKYKIRKSIKKIFLFFGGTINKEILVKIISKIHLIFPKKIKFYLYVNSKIDQKKIPKNFYILKINKNYFNDLLNYDAGIISSGFIKFDLLTIGMPIMYIPMYSHQIKIAKYYSKNNFGLNLGSIKLLDYLKKSNKDTVLDYLFSYKKRFKYYKFYRTNFDGMGADRIKDYLLKL